MIAINDSAVCIFLRRSATEGCLTIYSEASISITYIPLRITYRIGLKKYAFIPAPYDDHNKNPVLNRTGLTKP
jgi:hypothetical protein